MSYPQFLWRSLVTSLWWDLRISGASGWQRVLIHTLQVAVTWMISITNLCRWADLSHPSAVSHLQAMDCSRFASPRAVFLLRNLQVISPDWHGSAWNHFSR